MKKLATLLSLLVLSVAAQATAPTAESVDRLVNDMHVEGMVEALRPQLESMMKQMELQAKNGKVPSPDEQKVIDKFHTKAMDIMAAALTVEKIRPIYVRVYAQNFTQEEIDGVTAFVESPAGNAYLTKLPKLVQGEMANMLAPLIPEVRQAAKEMQDELAALRAKDAK